MNLMQRLEANSTWEPNSGCRIWLGALVREHGAVKVAGKLQTVHRVAWELEHGPIAKGLWVLHNCGVSPCFNVNHLRLGTRDDNASDRHGHGGYRGKEGGGLTITPRHLAGPLPARMKRSASGVGVVLSHDDLVRVLSYDPESGNFHWKPRTDRDHSWNMRFSREIAGSIFSNGYRYINFNGKLHTAHRLAWLYVHGEWPKASIDHINGTRDDNRLANLRGATNAENGANTGLRSTNKSGVKGVSWDKKKKSWVAMITANNKQMFLGNFATIPEAAEARRVAEAQFHGTYARSAASQKTEPN